MDEKQQRSLRVLEKIVIKIMLNDKEPEAQKLIAEWFEKYHPAWFLKPTSVPANLAEKFDWLTRE